LLDGRLGTQADKLFRSAAQRLFARSGTRECARFQSSQKIDSFTSNSRRRTWRSSTRHTSVHPVVRYSHSAAVFVA